MNVIHFMTFIKFMGTKNIVSQMLSSSSLIMCTYDHEWHLSNSQQDPPTLNKQNASNSREITHVMTDNAPISDNRRYVLITNYRR